MSKIVEIDYTNWRGERRIRKIEPWALVFKDSPYHPGRQWILEAWDMENESDTAKDFALSGIHSFRPINEEE